MLQRLHAPVLLSCDPDCTVVRDAVVDTDDTGRISYCGPATEAPAFDGPVRHLEGILLPGLINSHAHSPMTVLRGMGGDLPLLRWLREIIFPAEARMQPADIRAGMVLGSTEMLRHGVTTSAEMYYEAEQIADAVIETGNRVVIGLPIIDLPGLDWRRMVDAVDAWIDADGLRSGPQQRVEIGYGPHSAYMLPREALERTRESAKTRGALVQIHVAEASDEDREQRAEHGSVPQLLASVGLLDCRVVAAHCVHLDDDDISVLATHGVGVAHCPGSNAKLASGIARLTDMRAAGISVGLGTDGPASNDDLDVWHEIQLSAMLARLSTNDSTALSAEQALLLATRGGAAAIGRDDIGAVEIGRWADLVHVDADDPTFPGGTDVPDHQLVANLVWGAGSRRVTDVWVAGEQVVAGGEPTKVDRQQAQAAVAAAGARVRRELGQ